MLDLNSFINQHVIHRHSSMFLPDIEAQDGALSDAIRGKSLLVIGGAGSIGSSFIRAVLPYEPAELYVVDTNENALTELTRSLRSTEIYMPQVYKTYPMDYASQVFRKMFRQHRREKANANVSEAKEGDASVQKGSNSEAFRGDAHGFDIVANFSAHKHVRSEKDIYSIEALLRNNVINAMALLELLKEHPPELYFCVSTDKAANPVNIMGASKRIMEDLIFAYSDAFPVKTARFANVAFSQGSLPDGFLHRLRMRQPLTAPADVRRYFVSPEESGQICMLAAMLGKNREIFFPKLDESTMMSFDQIALALLKEHGMNPIMCEDEEDAISQGDSLRPRTGDTMYPVYFSPSDTSGEKPYEEFYTEQESVDLQRFTSLGVITEKERPDREKVQDLVRRLNEAFERVDLQKEDIVEILSGYLSEFQHIETGKSLDDKM